MLTLERLREVLRYDPITGELAWVKSDRGRRRKVGCVQVENGRPRYVKIYIDNRPYRAHILAWRLMKGDPPPPLIDHEDRDPTNNKWLNLRDASKRLNSLNHNLYKNSASGVTGVHWCNTRLKWIVRSNNRYVGQFDSKQDAMQIAELRHMRFE